jgi:hypothetical protein
MSSVSGCRLSVEGGRLLLGPIGALFDAAGDRGVDGKDPVLAQIGRGEKVTPATALCEEILFLDGEGE